MNYFVYYKDGEELLPFYNWVLEHGTDDEKETHDAGEDAPSVKFDELLDRYLKENGATHVREFAENGEPVSDLAEVFTF